MEKTKIKLVYFLTVFFWIVTIILIFLAYDLNAFRAIAPLLICTLFPAIMLTIGCVFGEKE